MAFADTFTGTKQNEIVITLYCPVDNLTQLTKPFVGISYFDARPVVDNVFIAEIPEPDVAVLTQQFWRISPLKHLALTFLLILISTHMAEKETCVHGIVQRVGEAEGRLPINKLPRMDGGIHFRGHTQVRGCVE